MPNRKPRKSSQNRYSSFLNSAWFFPAILLIALVLLTIFRISGSSVGIYFDDFYGKEAVNTSLIANEPRSVRSDEWLFTTQLVVAQSVAGFPRINHNIENGRDMSLVGDAPYKDWSSVFRPQNLAFFVMPLENAFAFKWWLLLVLTIVSCYFFILRYLPNRRLLSSILATAFGCSPFLFWWYQTAAFAPIFYGFFIMLIGLRIINYESIPLLKKHHFRYTLALYCIVLAYLLTCFVLVLYPPFQIPIAIVIALFLTGTLLEKYGFKKLFSRESLIVISVFMTSALIAISLVFAFINTREQAIKSIRSTVYPGSRHILAGSEIPVNIFSSYLQPQLQDQSHADNYYDNQSEASNFLALAPFLLIPSFALMYIGYRNTRKISWSSLAIQLSVILFLADMFVGALQPLYNLLLLDQVPLARLRIGLGFAGLIQLVLLIKLLTSYKFSKKTVLLSGIYSLSCLWVLLKSAQSTYHSYPLFISNRPAVIFWAIGFSLIIFGVLVKRFALAAIIFLVFSLGCVIHIHPLYKGLAPLYPSKLGQAIDSVSKPGDTWVTLDDTLFENTASMSNRNSLSGIQPYPDIAFWRQVEGSKADYIYNRYAHVLFTSDPSSTYKITLMRPDNFHVKFTCSTFIKESVQFALSTHRISQDCTRLITTVQYPSKTFFIYKVF